MREAAAYEADRIKGTQQALVVGGLRHGPDAGELGRAEAFEALVRLVDLVACDRQFLERLKRTA
jgi:hypothetical protein